MPTPTRAALPPTPSSPRTAPPPPAPTQATPPLHPTPPTPPTEHQLVRGQVFERGATEREAASPKAFEILRSFQVHASEPLIRPSGHGSRLRRPATATRSPRPRLRRAPRLRANATGRSSRPHPLGATSR